ncbi:MAG: hypothetical protein AAGF88_12860 [Pseudomonadota bacterium]
MRLRDLIAALAVACAPAAAQSLQELGDGRLEALETWDELCEITDCALFPMGYNTYVLGSEVYYFPNAQTVAAHTGSGATAGAGRFYDGSSANEPSARSFQDRGRVSILCCDALLRFYGLAETMPPMRDPAEPYVLSNTRLTATSSAYWLTPDHAERHLGDALAHGLGDYPPFDAVETEHAYNDDFWVLSAGDADAQGFRPFRLLSNRPLLHGRHVLTSCGAPLCPHCSQQCSIRTLSFAGDETELRPNVDIRWVGFTAGNIFPCSLDEIAHGCDPSPDALDGIPEVLAAIEDMFEAAQVVPE